MSSLIQRAMVPRFIKGKIISDAWRIVTFVFVRSTVVIRNFIASLSFKRHCRFQSHFSRLLSSFFSCSLSLLFAVWGKPRHTSGSVWRHSPKMGFPPDILSLNQPEGRNQ